MMSALIEYVGFVLSSLRNRTNFVQIGFSVEGEILYALLNLFFENVFIR